MSTLGEYMGSVGHEAHYIVGGSEMLGSCISTIGRTATFGINGNKVEIALPISAKRAREVLADTNPDIVHLQMPNNPFVSGRIVNRTAEDVPVVGSYHVLPNSLAVSVGLHALGKFEKRFGRVDHIISNSEATKEFVDDIYGVESSLIPCPIDIQELRKGTVIPEYDDSTPNIVFLGRLVERKGIQHLIDALSKLGKTTDYRLVIAGTGPLETSLHEQINHYDLSKRVEFLGYVTSEQKANLFASADLVVFPATGGESFGIGLAEAMAARAGVVIGGDNLGYRSVLGDTPELLVDPTDSFGLAYIIQELLDNQSKRQELHEIQQQAVQRFDVSVVGAQVEEIYKSLLG